MEAETTESFEDWDGLARDLGLNSAQSRRLREKANGLKDAFAEFMARPGEGGAPSPLAYLAEALHERLVPDVPWTTQGAALHEAYTRFMNYAQQQHPEASAETYAQLFGARSQQVLGEMEDELDQRQRALFRVSLAPRVLEWPTGHDPFGARVAEAVAQQSGTGPSGVRGAQEASEARSDAARITPWENIAEHGRSEEWSSLALLCRALDLDEKQAQQTEARLNALKDEVAELMSREDGGGDTPAKRLAEISFEEGGLASPAVKGRFMGYLCATSPVDGPETYQALFTQAEQRAHTELCAILRPEQATAFHLIPAGALPEIRTGYDPVGPVVAPHLEALKKRKGAEASRTTIAWPDLCHALALTPEQTTAISEHLRRLRQEFDVLFEAPAADGQRSPRAVLRQLLEEGVAEAEAMAQFQDYAATTSHHLFQRPYATIFARIESDIRGAVYRVLREEQHQRLMALDLESLLHVQLEDYGPTVDEEEASFQAIVTAAANQLKDEALHLYETPPEGGGATPLQVLADATRNNSKTAGVVLQRYLATHRPEGSPESYGRKLQLLDQDARRAVLAKCPKNARPHWEERIPPLLLTLDTGYNPLLASLRALLATAE